MDVLQVMVLHPVSVHWKTVALTHWGLCLNVRQTAEGQLHRDGIIQQNFIIWQQKKVPMRKTINGDAFSREIKEKAIELIRKDMGKVDLVVYSLAAPRRTDAEGKTWSSCLKTTEEAFTEKSLDLRNNQITEKTVEPATEEEVLSTVKVMGGEDWADWIDALKAADVLTENAVTVAYSYIGPELTYPIYYHGTIGISQTAFAENHD